MAMNFFQQQQDARRRTVRLLLLFALAVVVLTMITAVCMAFFSPIFLGASGVSNQALNDMVMDGHLLAADYLWFSALFAPVIILSASAYKLWQLADGGKSIALNMGGTLLDLPKNHKERQLLNIVEEMAIASGMSVPPVYLLQDEPGINAFTAGYGANDMVIGITRGCLKMLSREELQGVIAHEFSHMQNGDTRLNTRMIGVLYGITMIALIGMKLADLSFWSNTARDIEDLRRGRPVGRSSEDSSSGGVFGGTFIILLFSLCLIAIGSLGWFFAAMIKAAVCREREYFADAAAVQFTRNPDGIAGALKKIGGSQWHSHLFFSGRAMVEHMLFSFADNPQYEFSGHATHPPLAERIRRIDPSWDGEFIRFSKLDLAMMEDESEKPPYDAVKTAQVLGTLAASPIIFTPAIKKPPEDLNNLDYARDVLVTLPADWLACARNPDLSCCVLLALLLCDDPAIARTQLTRIEQAHRLWSAQCEHLMRTRPKVSIAHRLPLIEIALPRLNGHIEDAAAYQRFKTLLQEMIRADRQVSLFEWCVYAIASGYLKKTFAEPRITLLGSTTAKTELLSTYRRLFSLAARFCNHGQNPAAAYHAACAVAAIPAGEGCDDTVRLGDLPRILRTLNQLPPLDKPQLLHALVAIIRHDGSVDPAERELLRAIGITLDSPLPPLGES